MDYIRPNDDAPEQHNCLRCCVLQIDLTLYKPWIILMGYRPTLQTRIRHHNGIEFFIKPLAKKRLNAQQKVNEYDQKNTTITHCRPTHGPVRKRHKTFTVTRHPKDNNSKATSSLSPSSR